MNFFKRRRNPIAREPEFTIDISNDPHALVVAILTLAASNLLHPIPKKLPPQDAARDILGLYLTMRKLFLTDPERR